MKGKSAHLELLKKALNDSALTYKDGVNENNELTRNLYNFLSETKIAKEDSDFLTKAMIEINSSFKGNFKNSFLSSLQDTSIFLNRSTECQLLVMQEICMYFWKHNRKMEAYDFLTGQINSIPYSNSNFFNGLAGWMSFEYTKGIKSLLTKDRFYKRSSVHFKRYLSLIDRSYEPMFIESWIQLSYLLTDNCLPLEEIKSLLTIFPQDKYGLIQLLLKTTTNDRERLTLLLETSLCSLFLPFLPIQPMVANEIQTLLEKPGTKDSFHQEWAMILKGDLESLSKRRSSFYFFNEILPISPE